MINPYVYTAVQNLSKIKDFIDSSCRRSVEHGVWLYNSNNINRIVGEHRNFGGTSNSIRHSIRMCIYETIKEMNRE